MLLQRKRTGIRAIGSSGIIIITLFDSRFQNAVSTLSLANGMIRTRGILAVGETIAIVVETVISNILIKLTERATAISAYDVPVVTSFEG